MEREPAIAGRDACIAAGAHAIDRSADGNNWCAGCDTGECPDCQRPTFYGAGEAYHHIETPETGCFLIPEE